MKSEKRRVKSNKGITLIALVITIVVMLILAGVTINLTLGENGIFTTAQKAAKNYTDAQNKEIAEIQNFTQIVDKTIQNVTENWDTLASKAKPGDYVKYDGGNGYTGLWQVLYNDSTYGLQIISADNVLGKNEDGTDIGFTLGNDDDEAKAKSDYNNAVNLLNAECRKYVNPLYAKDATSGRCVGSNPLNPDDNPDTMEKVTLDFQYNESTASGCVVKDTVAEKELDDHKAMIAATSQNTAGIHDLDKIYWLASRGVYTTSDRGYFGVRAVFEDGDVRRNNFWYVDTNGNSNSSEHSHGLRPVITLAADIQTNDGDGSINNAFKLVAK